MKSRLRQLFLLMLVFSLPTGGLISAPPRFNERGLVMEDLTKPAKPPAKESKELLAKIEENYKSIALDENAEPYIPKSKGKKKTKKSKKKSRKEKKRPAKPKPDTKQAMAKAGQDEKTPAHEEGSQNVSVEWVGKGRRIKRLVHTPGVVKEKQYKKPGQLIITDDDQYHRTIPELLQNGMQRRYGARLEESDWMISSNTKFLCELRHTIPDFGHAVFKREVGEGLQFAIESDRHMGGSGPARIQSMPPGWQHFASSKDLGVVSVEPKGRALFNVPEDWANRLMLELMDGMVPTISFWDESTGGDDVRLTISSLNFKQQLPDFNRCIGNLLPYSFKDVRKTTIYFGYDKTGVSDKARERLKKVVNYVKLDERVKKIKVIGYSDSLGFKSYNKILAKRRATAVKKILLAEGIPEKKLQVLARGEKDPRSSNRTRKGRARNRRVLVMLQK